jgi:16S rRNA (cytosine1402-N4)-methyltransferase
MEAEEADVFHRPVMVTEVLAALQCRPGGVYLDGTAGGGGHAFEILKNSSPDGLLVGTDVDADAIQETKRRLVQFGKRAVLVNDNFSSMRTILARLGIDKVDGILLDLGVSSHQLNSAARGFSFTSEAPLDMRMDKERGPSAYDLIHTLSNAELERIIREYGEEKTARRIALAITRRRVISSIKTTTELARIVAGAFPVSRPKNKIHPATRTFQAIRIAVNNELKNLQQALEEGVDLLASGGRLCVISFHSLEDRIVKNSFSQYARGCICPPDLPVCACGRKPILKIVTRKPVIPEETEIKENPRARSAKLRAAERI